jgi:hypothetical protein
MHDAFFAPDCSEFRPESKWLTLLFIRIPHGCWMRMTLRILYTDVVDKPIDPERFIPFDIAIPTGPDEAMSYGFNNPDGAALLRHIAAQVQVLEIFHLDGMHPDAAQCWREHHAKEVRYP